jgi:septal ring-binding cell division protein DamX
MTWRIEQLHKTRMGAEHWIILPGIYETRGEAVRAVHAASKAGKKQRITEVAEKPDVC